MWAAIERGNRDAMPYRFKGAFMISDIGIHPWNAGAPRTGREFCVD